MDVTFLVLITWLLSDLILVNAAKCVIDSGLRDKWVFFHENKKTFLRIRPGSMRFEQKRGEKIKYKCVENAGNVYLLKKKKYLRSQDGVLCVGFSYVTNHPRAEYNIIRFNSQGVSGDLMSPELVARDYPISINKTCHQLHTGKRTSYAFVKRRRSGCKFPKELRKDWNYTLYHSKKLIIGLNKLTILYLDGSSLTFNCDRRDGDSYVLRVPDFIRHSKDAIMCLRIKPLLGNPYYNFEVSRLNSGVAYDGWFMLVPREQLMYLHQDCDWIDSPSRPEFIYP